MCGFHVVSTVIDTENIDFESLYERYAPDLLRFALFLTRDPHEAQEIVSESFLRAWTSFGRLRAPTVKSYLFTIARNLVIDRKRRGKPSVELPAEIAARASDPTAVRLLEQTMAAIDQLPEAQRICLLLHAVGELSYPEIAATLGEPLSTVKVRIHRARLKLDTIMNAGKELRNESTVSPTT